MATWFSPLTEPNYNGLHKSSASATSLEPGMIVTLDSNGDVTQVSANTQEGYGLVIGSKQLEYKPLDNKIAVGTYTTVIQGIGEAQMTLDGFAAAPAIGAKLYPSVDGSGKLTTTRSGSIPAVGRCTGIDSISAPELGSTTVYRFHYSLPTVA